MILVVGATGLLGGQICRQLRAHARPTCAFVREGSPRGAQLRELGVRIVYGDLKNRDSVEAACREASVVITTANSILSRRRGDSLRTVDRDGSLTLLRAAQVTGVGHFVFVSVSPSLPANNEFVRYKREVEAEVRSSPMKWTIIQPAAFMEIHAGPVGGWDFVRGRARLMGSGHSPMSYISSTDVAAFTVAAVENPAATNRLLHIAGPEPLSGLDAVAIAERVTGRAFTVQRIPIAALRVLRAVFQPFYPTISSLLAMGIGMEQGERVAMDRLLREFAIQPTTFEQYVRRHSSDMERPGQ